MKMSVSSTNPPDIRTTDIVHSWCTDSIHPPYRKSNVKLLARGGSGRDCMASFELFRT